VCKRTLDIVLASVALLLTLPLMVVIALMIALEGEGPILFRQQRLGRDGVMTLHKFRTLRAIPGETDEVAPAGDPRITRTGAWLRKLRLDELPQLLDVIAGRMSLVGPRPQTPDNLAAVSSQAKLALLRLRPGLTSETALTYLAEDEVLARVAEPQTVYRTILVPARVADDLECFARDSLWRDLRTLLRTPFVLVSRRAWARSRDHVEAVLRRARVSLGAPRLHQGADRIR
jgi:lipopolysaccharide/colanic/teichoic acid biosynthesis glycosyltransferase